VNRRPRGLAALGRAPAPARPLHTPPPHTRAPSSDGAPRRAPGARGASLALSLLLYILLSHLPSSLPAACPVAPTRSIPPPLFSTRHLERYFSLGDVRHLQSGQRPPLCASAISSGRLPFLLLLLGTRTSAFRAPQIQVESSRPLRCLITDTPLFCLSAPCWLLGGPPPSRSIARRVLPRWVSHCLSLTHPFGSLRLSLIPVTLALMATRLSGRPHGFLFIPVTLAPMAKRLSGRPHGFLFIPVTLAHMAKRLSGRPHGFLFIPVTLAHVAKRLSGRPHGFLFIPVTLALMAKRLSGRPHGLPLLKRLACPHGHSAYLARFFES
jgi:hypothetical protein